MASSNSVKILETCRVAPPFNSSESHTESYLPLTVFDTCWLKFPTVESIFFYELTESSPAYFNSVILPRLKQSLSHALLHFLPLAGHLAWPSQSPKPIISYSSNHSVSLTIAQSNAEFNQLSSNATREATESHLYIPELLITDTMASLLALQITLFPSKGICIGLTTHHAVADGKSTHMFINSWTYFCKKLEKDQPILTLPDELTPVLDRTLIKDVHGLEMLFLNQWFELTKLDLKSNPRSLKLWQLEVRPDSVRATFELTREDIENLKERVLSQLGKVTNENTESTEPMNLSTFVVTCAYVLVCMVKVKTWDMNREVHFIFSGDSRSRLDPPLPANYFGNCICGHDISIKARTLYEENAFAIVAERVAYKIKELKNDGPFDGAKERIPKFASMVPGTQCISVAGTTRLGFYELDFGWGRPKKVEITSIDKTRAISLMQSKDAKGGVEIGLVLQKHEMENFASSFANGLKDY